MRFALLASFSKLLVYSGKLFLARRMDQKNFILKSKDEAGASREQSCSVTYVEYF